jgi:hypothetical protein
VPVKCIFKQWSRRWQFGPNHNTGYLYCQIKLNVDILVIIRMPEQEDMIRLCCIGGATRYTNRAGSGRRYVDLMKTESFVFNDASDRFDLDFCLGK